ncbi:T-cell surface glycoprotein CD8 alpha chain [Brachyhypopomus gauderio]|uniref:T-cell surface glycoprotein CD8 alpha chain n=1 Tax=Brachyhypopomus gauderio TaxID=698409 RepID=UPI0040431095
MYLLCIGLSSLLFLPHGAFPKEVENGKNEVITCETPKEQGTFWFRMPDGAKFNFIAYVSATQNQHNNDKYSIDKNKNTLTIKNFNKTRDSGLYSCVSVNRNALRFGEVSRLHGPPDPTPTLKPITTAAKTTERTTTPCSNINEVKSPSDVLGLPCELHVLVPLVVGNGLLLLLLVITILYCNRIRTRRCPHHYKRRPRDRPAGHNALPNQHIF